jgi:hypothetical protein
MLLVFENVVLRRMFAPKRAEVPGGRRKFRNVYASPYIIGIIKSRAIRWAGCVARLIEMSSAYKNFGWKPEEKRH